MSELHCRLHPQSSKPSLVGYAGQPERLYGNMCTVDSHRKSRYKTGCGPSSSKLLSMFMPFAYVFELAVGPLELLNLAVSVVILHAGEPICAVYVGNSTIFED